MNNIKPKEFIKNTKGMTIDYDKSCGVQCVDAIKYFNSLIYGKAGFDCGECGYAYGLYSNYGTNGVEKYFDKELFKNVQLGDWIVWNYGSKEAPYSHVGMYVETVNSNHVKIWGQTSGRGFDYNIVDTNGILGILRPKIYSHSIEIYLEPKGYFGKGDNSEKIKNICEWFSINRIDGTYFGNYLETIVKQYQKEKGKNKVGEADGYIGPRTLSAMVEDGFKI